MTLDVAPISANRVRECGRSDRMLSGIVIWMREKDVNGTAEEKSSCSEASLFVIEESSSSSHDSSSFASAPLGILFTDSSKPLNNCSALLLFTPRGIELWSSARESRGKAEGDAGGSPTTIIRLMSCGPYSASSTR